MTVSFPLLTQLRRLFNDSHVFVALKVFIALISLLLMVHLMGQPILLLPMSLGVFAAALSESYDSLRGRLKHALISQICFFIASITTSFLMPWPLLLAPVLFGLALLQAMVTTVNRHYAAIGIASRLLVIGTLLTGSFTPDAPFYQLPLLLVAGALWFTLVSLFWFWLLPFKTLHEQLAQCYFALSRYLECKAQLFSAKVEDIGRIRHQLTQCNIEIMTAFTQVEGSYQSWHGGEHPELQRLRLRYIQALEIHERATSSHYAYEHLEEELHEIAPLIGFQQILLLLGEACEQFGYALLRKQPYQPSRRSSWALGALAAQLELAHQRHDYPSDLHSALLFMSTNLTKIERLLREEQPREALPHWDRPLKRPFLVTLLSQANWNSASFRHGLRMAIGLTLAYSLVEGLHLDHGHWITFTLFAVSQPSYGATKQRLMVRMSGTMIGMLLGIPLLALVTDPMVLQVLLILCAASHFLWLLTNNLLAVISITFYVLFAITLQQGTNADLFVIRIVDTLVGCLLAWGLVAWLWPQWQYHRLPQLISASLSANNQYLTQILEGISAKQHNPLNYYQARRAAYLADSELALAWQSMLVEPKSQRKFLDLCYQLTWHNHTLLSYISALGVHRNGLTCQGSLNAMTHYLTTLIDDAILQLAGEPGIPINAIPEPLYPQNDNKAAQMIANQLRMLTRQIEALHALAVQSQRLKSL